MDNPQNTDISNQPLCNLPKPVYPFPQYPTCFQGCGCGDRAFLCDDCYFYYEEHDMGATMPCCSHLNTILESKKPQCSYYFSRKRVRQIVENEL